MMQPVPSPLVDVANKEIANWDSLHSKLIDISAQVELKFSKKVYQKLRLII